MKNKQIFIENIKQNFENEKNTKSYARVQRMAKTLSENLYSEDSHFIYELIQNAQDNNYNVDNKKLDFFIYDNGILIQNNEIGFDESNIESICDFNDSTKSKKKSLGYIGEKGIGFKSVFSITDRPAISSNGYYFYFKKDEYIEPYWINNLQMFPIEFQKSNTTNIYLPYSKTFKNQADIKKKIKDIESILLLFLDNIDEINIYENNKEILSVSKKIKRDKINQIVTIKSNNQENSFIVFNKKIDCINIQEEKREGVTRRNIILAFPLNEISDTRLFAFLPTEIETGLPFLIQADFLLTASRGDILKDKEWNRWLLQEIVDFFTVIFKNLQKEDPYRYLKYLKQFKSSYHFIDEYYQLILDNLSKEKLFLTTQDKFVSASEIYILKNHDFMFQYLELINDKVNYMNKEFYYPAYLKEKWNIKTINIYEFLEKIQEYSQEYAQVFQQNNLLFEKLLTYIELNIKSNNYQYLLDKLPIIPIDNDQNIVFKTKIELAKKQLFFYLDDDGILKNIFPEIKVISVKYKNRLTKIDFYKKSLNVNLPNIYEIITSLKEDFFKDIRNNINLLIYIKNKYFETKDFKIISLLKEKYLFITKRNTFKKQLNDNTYPIYISNEYLTEAISIETIVQNHCFNEIKNSMNFVSELYLKNEEKDSIKDSSILQKEWKAFFEQIGINDNIKLEKQELEMYAWDSQDNRRTRKIDINNIIFIAEAKFERFYYKKNMELKNLTNSESIFLFNKVLNIKETSNYFAYNYNRVTGFFREFQTEKVPLPWIEFIKDELPIYIDGKFSKKINEFYLSVDKSFQKYFQKLPMKYQGIENSDNIQKIFQIKEKPDFKDIVALIENKRIDKIQDVQNIFNYLSKTLNNEELYLRELPYSVNNTKIDYCPIENFVWENGKDLSLRELRKIYNDRLEPFFIYTIGVKKEPSIEQYITYLQKSPKNYRKVFFQFIFLLEKNLNSESISLNREKIFLINNRYFSKEEIIFNDESIETIELNNLFTIQDKYYTQFLKIVNHYKIKKISNFDRDTFISNETNDNTIYDIYVKLLNFTWDYIYSKDSIKFESLKKDKQFILNTQNVKEGSLSEIKLIIDVYGTNIVIKKDVTIQKNKIFLSKSIEERKKVSVIAKYIAEKSKLAFEKIERFYDKVYTSSDYTKREYYIEEKIEEAKGDDAFIHTFNIIKDKGDEKPFDIKKSGIEKEYQTNNKEIKKQILEKTKIEHQCPKCKKFIEKDKLKLHIITEHRFDNINIEDNSIFDETKKNEITLTYCPECDCKINKKNLALHLCKVHHINCTNIPNLSNAIHLHTKDINNKEEEINPNIIKDEKKYCQELQENYNKKIKKSNGEIQNNYVNKKIKIGKKETLIFLNNQYKGYCQICGFSFNKKNNQGKYFISFDWLSEKITKQKVDIIDAGSSLCLCSRCHSILKYGDFEANFLKKLNTTNLKNTSFDDLKKVNTVNIDKEKIPSCYDFIEMDMYKIPIRLLNKDCNIFYTEEHFSHFYNILTLNEN